ncbi:MAG: 50S ribosomal protein L17 [Ignavibacteria bacterium]|nr:MAG: 50S ribosomal protein L17 [Ignavibacteria bacterium]
MRHRVKGRKLGRTSAHREATLRLLATSLLKHKKIKTTVAKAKELRTYVEPLITKAKNDTVANRRHVARFIKDKEVVKELFGEIIEKIGDRPGGYTRIVKLGQRRGDAAEMAIIELVDFAAEGEEKPKKAKKAEKVEKPEVQEAEVVEETTEETKAEEAAEEVAEAEVEEKSEEENTEAKAEESAEEPKEEGSEDAPAEEDKK